MKVKVYLLSLITFLINQNNFACDAFVSMCHSGTYVSDEIIVTGTISNSSTNSIELTITNVLVGTENSNTITIWDGTTLECNGPWTHDANDMGTIGDTILCMIVPITSIENAWEVIGDYRRPSILGGVTYTNFSNGGLFEWTYNYDEVLEIDLGTHCCNNLNQSFSVGILGLPLSTSSLSPITLTGNPAGGTFSGPGVNFNAFSPVLAGPGNHTITYTLNEEFGCSFSTQRDIFVFTISYNFVNYNLGTIAPRLINEIDIQLEVPKPDEYSFRVFDLLGNEVYSEKEHFEAGVHLQNISFNQILPKGIYMLNVSNNEANVTKRFVIRE